MSTDKAQGGKVMWFEVISTTTALLTGATGTVLFVKHRKMPFSERHSIRNVKKVLEEFVDDCLAMTKENYSSGDKFTYKRANFEIVIYVHQQTTTVHLKDHEINGDKIFFSFEYHNQSKEILEVKENCSYYERYGHFDTLQTLLKACMKKVMATDWGNLEKEEKMRLKEKYRISEVKPFVEETSTTLTSSFQNEEVKKLLKPYFSRYQYIKSQEGKLELEEAHVIERDYNYLQLLCQHFETLGEAQQTKEFSTVKERIKEKIEQLDAFIALLEQDALYEFKKIAEVMKTDNR